MNRELNRKDGLDAMTDNLQFASIDGYDYSDISIPQPVVILTVSPAGKCASGLLFVPTYDRRLECAFVVVFIAGCELRRAKARGNSTDADKADCGATDRAKT